MTITVSTQLNAQVTSMTDLLARVRVVMRDPNAGSGRWTDTEIYSAITRALFEMLGSYQYRDAYETTFVNNQRDYTLPGYVDIVESVERVDSGGYGIPLRSYSTIKTPYLSLLRFRQLQPAGFTLRLVVRRHLEVPPVPGTLAVAMTDTTGTLVDISGESTVYPVPGYILINNEYMYYDTQTAGTLTGVTRGMFGSTAATHVISSVVDPVIAVDPQVIGAVLIGCQIYLSEMRLQDGPTQEAATLLTIINMNRPIYLEAKQSIAALKSRFPGVVPPLNKNHRRRGFNSVR